MSKSIEKLPEDNYKKLQSDLIAAIIPVLQKWDVAGSTADYNIYTALQDEVHRAWGSWP